MIAEAYICTKGPNAGTIEWSSSSWFNRTDQSCPITPQDVWQPYAAFEREKLVELQAVTRIEVTGAGYKIKFTRAAGKKRGVYLYSDILTGYTGQNYMDDSESSRLLKRAEFLKAVCEKEGVPWLSKCDCWMHEYQVCDVCQGKSDVCEKCWCECSRDECRDDHIPCERHQVGAECKHCGSSICWHDPCCQKWLDELKPDPLVQTTGADGFKQRPLSTQSEAPCVRCKGDAMGGCEKCQREMAAEKSESAKGQKGCQAIPDTWHLTKTDDPTQTCEKCGHVGNPYEHRKNYETTILLISQIQRNLQKVYCWHDTDLEFRKAMLDFLDVHFNTAENVLNMPPHPMLDDLRRRFLP